MALIFTGEPEEKFIHLLQERVRSHNAVNRTRERALRLLRIKAIVYSGLFLLIYLSILWWPAGSLPALFIRYLLLGLASLLMAFIISHDASHGTFSQNTSINDYLFTISFSLLGVNAYLWKIRHIASHHVFPNVDGGDVDIEDNTLVRFCPHRPWRPFHRYQHFYAPVLYAFFTLYWSLVKDFIYFRKKRIGNLERLHHPAHEYWKLLFWKSTYFLLMLGLPVWVGRLPLGWVLTAWLLMHVTLSLVLILTLITSHLTLETAFPKADPSGKLPYPYYWHQLATSLDFYPSSRLANWFWGGFNSHTAHHLFPRWPHPSYPELSVIIRQTAIESGYPYHERTFWQALRSHFLFLKKMGRPMEYQLQTSV